MKPVKPIPWRAREANKILDVAFDAMAKGFSLSSVATPQRNEHVLFVRVSKCCPVRRIRVAAPVLKDVPPFLMVGMIE